MYKRINAEDAELGMYIHKFEGSWFKHPFWKSRFLLTDERKLRILRASDVDGVIIDVNKGKDIEQSMFDPAPLPTAITRPSRIAATRRRAAAECRLAQPVDDLRSVAPQPLQREFGNARLVEDRAHKVMLKVFMQSRLGKAIKVKAAEPVVDDIYASIQRNAQAFNGLMHCKNAAQDVYRHSIAVCALMISLARQMKLPPEQIREAGMAGLLMDIGVCRLPVEQPLDDADYQTLPAEVRRQHVMLGYDMLVRAGNIPDPVLMVSIRHHERMDGSGYPKALKGDEIDLFSRMAAICDCYDNLVAWRADGSALDPARAIRKLEEEGEAFDREILGSFVDFLGVYPIGSFVTLRSGRLAMVVAENPADTNLPLVRSFWSLELDKAVPQDNIDLANCFGQDAITGFADLTGLVLPEIPALREMLFASALKGMM